MAGERERVCVVTAWEASRPELGGLCTSLRSLGPSWKPWGARIETGSGLWLLEVKLLVPLSLNTQESGPGCKVREPTEASA